MLFGQRGQGYPPREPVNQAGQAVAVPIRVDRVRAAHVAPVSPAEDFVSGHADGLAFGKGELRPGQGRRCAGVFVRGRFPVIRIPRPRTGRGRPQSGKPRGPANSAAPRRSPGRPPVEAFGAQLFGDVLSAFRSRDGLIVLVDHLHAAADHVRAPLYGAGKLVTACPQIGHG